MRASEDHWETVWRFLSLDLIRPFLAELWLWTITPELQMGIRSLLKSALDEGEAYHTDYTRVHARILTWYRDRQGDEETHYLHHWVAERFFMTGLGFEKSESQWWGLCYQFSRAEPANDVSRIVWPLLQELREPEDELEQRIDALDVAKPTEWDLEMKAVYPDPVYPDLDLELSGEIAWMSNITRSNNFIETWERYSSRLSEQELDVLYDAARVTKNDSVSYPGAWRLELRYLIDRMLIEKKRHLTRA